MQKIHAMQKLNTTHVCSATKLGVSSPHMQVHIPVKWQKSMTDGKAWGRTTPKQYPSKIFWQAITKWWVA